MSIVSSVFVLSGPAQKDGRQYVRETHTDNVGLPRVIEYLAAIGANYTAIMNARAITMAVQIQDAEFAAAIQVDAMPTLNYQTVAEFVARMRALYKQGTQAQTCQLAWWLTNRINAGQVTEQQCATAFGITLVQFQTFRANKLTPQHDAWAAVLAAVGS